MNEKSTIVVTLDLFHLNYVKGFFSYDCARWFCTVMSECFVVFFQIFVAHLERNIRFWWFLRTFWSLGIRLVERYFCFLFFRESWEKANVTWLDGGNKVEFGQKKTYQFQPDLSTAGEDTKLILPNLPMLVRFSYLKKT